VWGGSSCALSTGKAQCQSLSLLVASERVGTPDRDARSSPGAVCPDRSCCETRWLRGSVDPVSPRDATDIEQVEPIPVLRDLPKHLLAENAAAGDHCLALPFTSFSVELRAVDVLLGPIPISER
jgi:hypothetical protein